MSSFDNIFGPAPGRPNHPDFETLVEIILRLDGKTEDADFDFPAHLSQYIDPGSLTYIAIQRAVRIVQAAPESLRSVLVVQLSSMYVDGFMAGYLFKEHKE